MTLLQTVDRIKQLRIKPVFLVLLPYQLNLNKCYLIYDISYSQSLDSAIIIKFAEPFSSAEDQSNSYRISTFIRFSCYEYESQSLPLLNTIPMNDFYESIMIHPLFLDHAQRLRNIEIITHSFSP